MRNIYYYFIQGYYTMLSLHACREISKLKHSLVKKIIEKKYFKTPQETNFLSWDAKEQIRYLHAEFPDEWTAERIATSFPISEEGVKKVSH